MIRNRLAEILFERDIKIVRIAKETGISRNTITNTASNNSEMLQMNTINKICGYLEITPCDFFDYIPIDIDFAFFENKKIEIVNTWSSSDIEAQVHFDIDMLIDITNKNKQYKIDTKIVLDNSTTSITPFEDNKIKLSIECSNEEKIQLTSIFNEIPKEFKKLIYNNLVDKYKSFILKELSNNKRIGAFYTEYEVIDKADFIFTDSFLKYY